MRFFSLCLSLIHIFKNVFLDKNDEICGYEFVHMGKFMDEIKKGTDANDCLLYKSPVNQHFPGIRAEVAGAKLVHLVLDEIQFLLVQADFLADGSCAV